MYCVKDRYVLFGDDEIIIYIFFQSSKDYGDLTLVDCTPPEKANGTIIINPCVLIRKTKIDDQWVLPDMKELRDKIPQLVEAGETGSSLTNMK